MGARVKKYPRFLIAVVAVLSAVVPVGVVVVRYLVLFFMVTSFLACQVEPYRKRHNTKRFTLLETTAPSIVEKIAKGAGDLNRLENFLYTELPKQENSPDEKAETSNSLFAHILYICEKGGITSEKVIDNKIVTQYKVSISPLISTSFLITRNNTQDEPVEVVLVLDQNNIETKFTIAYAQEDADKGSWDIQLHADELSNYYAAYQLARDGQSVSLLQGDIVLRFSYEKRSISATDLIWETLDQNINIASMSLEFEGSAKIATEASVEGYTSSPRLNFRAFLDKETLSGWRMEFVQ